MKCKKEGDDAQICHMLQMFGLEVHRTKRPVRQHMHHQACVLGPQTRPRT